MMGSVWQYMMILGIIQHGELNQLCVLHHPYIYQVRVGCHVLFVTLYIEFCAPYMVMEDIVIDMVHKFRNSGHVGYV